jgi:hypothetical protein
MAAGWAKLTQVELRVLLRSHDQPADGSKAALVQRLTAFLSDDGEATGDDDAGDERGRGPSASEAAELEAAGEGAELDAWRASVTQLAEAQAMEARAQTAAARAQTAATKAKAERMQQQAASEAAAATAIAALHPHRVRHNEQSCQLLQLVAQDDLRPTFMGGEVWGVGGRWRLRGVCRAFRGWAQAELSSLPRLVAVGGRVRDGSVNPP